MALVVVVTRWPFRTHYLFNWDAANFALGVRAFDVAQHQPHPPGYPYFVGLGALFDLALGDVNASLVVVSILLELLAVVGTYLLGARMYSHGEGLAVAALLAGSVTFWSYGAIALAYPALAAFSVLTAFYAYQTVVEGKDQLLPCAASYAVGSGFRPDLALFLFPLLLASCYRQPARRVMAALAIAFGGILLWLAPTAQLSGGFEQYLAVLSAYAATDVLGRYAPTVRGFSALLVNMRDTAHYLFFALYGELAVLAGGIGLLLWIRPRAAELRKCLFLLGWMAPMLLFYIVAHIGDPGYVFSFLPALLLLAWGGWHRLLEKPWKHARLLALSGLSLVLLANVLVFTLHARPLTLPGLQANDRSVAAKLYYLRSNQPREVLLVSYDSFKHFRYYLPEYPHSVWLDTSTAKRQVFPVPSGVKRAVFFDPSVFGLLQNLPAQAEFLPGETWAASLAVQWGQSLVYEAGRLRVE